ncbi:MAG: hypothetical protein GY869_23135, partial [Planctomycetes bacterium]|nr:hypothetical protein [Planctomycetota bacterium]
LDRIFSKFGFDYYRTQIRFPAEDRRLTYYCEVRDLRANAYLAKNGVTNIVPGRDDYIQVQAEIETYVPEWARHAVWYAIFPDRFRNSRPDNDPDMNELGQSWFAENGLGTFSISNWTDSWKELQPWEQKYRDLDHKCCGSNLRYARHYGGDFQGIIEKLPYLSELGITAIWFNPVTYAESNHKYDAASYHHIDPNFGFKEDFAYLDHNQETEEPQSWQQTRTDSLFLYFVRQAHGAGIKVIIDGVFNHTGNECWAFERAIREGPNSAYADWYHFSDWSTWHPDSSLAYNKARVQYESWWNYPSLPNLNTGNRAVLDHIFAVTRYWLNPDGDPGTDDGVDGFRLDVPNEVEPEFWLEWRKVVDEAKSGVYTSGELWSESPDWVRGDRLSAVMNYPWLDIALRFFRDKEKKISVSEFEARLAELRMMYPTQVSQCVQNLSGSHDLDRLLSGFINVDRKLDRANQEANGYDGRRPWEVDPIVWDKVKLFFLFQMTYVGAPMIYYGDEVGMYGADDPDCRKPMLWDDLTYADGDRPNLNLFDHIKKLIAIRKSSKAFSIGDFRPVLLDDEKDVFAYRRTYGHESFIIVLNNKRQSQAVELSLESGIAEVIELLHNRTYRVDKGNLQIELKGRQGLIF